MATVSPVLGRGSRRSRCASRLTALTLRPVASRLPFGPGGIPLTRALVEVAMRALGRVAPGTTVRAVDEGGVAGEWVDARTARGAARPEGVILYLHGSAYAICSARTHRGLASRLSRETGLEVFVVDYRLAPDFPFPAAADDVERAYRWLLDSGYSSDTVVVAGDSAGGHLALDLVIDNARHSIPQPRVVALFSPLIDLTFTLAENRERSARDPMISASAARELVALYTRDELPDSPRLHLTVQHGTALPHFVVQAGGAEMLAADAEHLRDLVVEAGGTCTLEIWPDQMHVFQALPRIAPEADAALRRSARHIEHALTTQP
ncbi:MAG: alpha/beta hydrolase [Rhodococcus sp. (in: high G+C Gram-positive bacteria)]